MKAREREGKREREREGQENPSQTLWQLNTKN